MTHLSEHEIDGPVALSTLAEQLIGELPQHEAGRTARTILTGSVMRATVIAVAEGAALAEHDAPPAATLYVISGRIRLVTGGAEQVLTAGQLTPIPAARHSVEADTDAAVLLTVALGAQGSPGHH